MTDQTQHDITAAIEHMNRMIGSIYEKLGPCPSYTQLSDWVNTQAPETSLRLSYKTLIDYAFSFSDGQPGLKPILNVIPQENFTPTGKHEPLVSNFATNVLVWTTLTIINFESVSVSVSVMDVRPSVTRIQLDTVDNLVGSITEQRSGDNLLKWWCAGGVIVDMCEDFKPYMVLATQTYVMDTTTTIRTVFSEHIREYEPKAGADSALPKWTQNVFGCSPSKLREIVQAVLNKNPRYPEPESTASPELATGAVNQRGLGTPPFLGKPQSQWSQLVRFTGAIDELDVEAMLRAGRSVIGTLANTGEPSPDVAQQGIEYCKTVGLGLMLAQCPQATLTVENANRLYMVLSAMVPLINLNLRKTPSALSVFGDTLGRLNDLMGVGPQVNSGNFPYSGSIAIPTFMDEPWGNIGSSLFNAARTLENTLIGVLEEASIDE